jgi:hypothetical protein
VAYEIEVYPNARDQIGALPPGALAAFAEAMAVLELVPWSGEPHNEKKPDGNMRQVVFGAAGRGLVIYLILEDQRRVDVLEVLWLG